MRLAMLDAVDSTLMKLKRFEMYNNNNKREKSSLDYPFKRRRNS